MTLYPVVGHVVNGDACGRRRLFVTELCLSAGLTPARVRLGLGISCRTEDSSRILVDRNHVRCVLVAHNETEICVFLTGLVETTVRVDIGLIGEFGKDVCTVPSK
jgi:hypothetical protein